MNIITTKQQLQELVEFYSGVSAFAFDTETAGDDPLQPVTNDVLWISMATEGRTDVIPLGHPNGEFLRWEKPLTGAGQKRLDSGKELREQDYSSREASWTPIFSEPPEQLFPGDVFSALRPLFFSDKLKIAHNAKFDLKSLAKYFRGKVPSKPYFDTMIASFIIDNRNKNSLGLADCCKRECNLIVEKGVGANITGNSFSVVAQYSGLDAEATWALYKALAPKLEGSLRHVWSLEMDCLQAFCDMELHGAILDTDGLQELKTRLEEGVDAARGKAYKAAGKPFSLNSVKEKQELLFSPKPTGRGLKPNPKIKIALTPKGNEVARSEPQSLTIYHYAVSADALEYFRGKDDVVDAILEYQDLNKLLTTYVMPYLGGEITRTNAGKSKTVEKKALLIRGRVHTDFKPHGAETGRVACVSGDTLLPTNRGVFRFDEYVPHAGDMVLTHANRWMPVLQKVYKGTAPMFSVVLENGAILHCTNDHKLLTYKGWVPLRSLSIGDEVASYVGIQEICERLHEPYAGGGNVHWSGQAYDFDGSKASGHYVSQCSCMLEDGTVGREAISGEETSVLPVETRPEEPYEGQVWLATPQLQGCNRRWVRIPAGEDRGEVRTSSPLFDGSRVRVEEPSSGMGRSPHRWEQAEQRLGQLSTRNEIRAFETSRGSSRIKEINALGSMGVWDISVAGDESYLAHGFLNHNSSNPNLQNIPSSGDYGKMVRNLFIAPEGHRLVVADYSQIEPRLIAAFSKDPVLVENYRTGGDIYTTIGDTMGVNRKAGKVLVLAISYGIGPDKIASQIGCSVADAKTLLNDFSARFPDIAKYKAKVVRLAEQKSPVPYVETLFGRRRYIPELRERETGLRATGERRAFNTVIQGSAADIMKLAIVRAHSCFIEEPDANVILTVHDELVTVCREDLAEEVAEAIRESMEGIRLKEIIVPLIADVKIVEKWGQAK